MIKAFLVIEMAGLEFMEYGTTTLIALAAFLGSYQVIRTWSKKDSRQPPCLPTVPLLGSIPFLPKVLDHKALTALGEKYGDIYQFYLGSGRMVVLNTYELLQEAFIKNTLHLSDRPDFYIFNVFNPHRKGMIEASPSEGWKKTRSAALSVLRDFGFGRNIMEGRLQTEANALIGQFEKHAGKAYNPDDDITISVSNVIISLLFNKRFHYDDQRFKRAVSNIGDFIIAMMECNIINVFPAYRFFPAGRSVWKRAHNAVTACLQFVREELNEHRLRTDPNDIDSDFLSAFKAKTENDVDEEGLAQLIKDFFAAGTETTTTTIKWALVRFANQPDIMRNLQDEIDTVIGDGRSPRLSDKPNMPYMEAFTLELLRHSSLAPLALPHCAAQDTEVGGYIISKGTTIMPNIWAVQRNEKEWPNPAKFDPTRFLDEDGKVIKKDRVVSFGVGKRSCLGEGLATQELFMFLTSLLQRFSFSRLPGAEPLSEEPVFGVTLSPQQFEILITPRA